MRAVLSSGIDVESVNLSIARRAAVEAAARQSIGQASAAGKPGAAHSTMTQRTPMKRFDIRQTAGRSNRARLGVFLLLAAAPAFVFASSDAGEVYSPPPPVLGADAAPPGEVREAPARIGRISLVQGEARWFSQSASADGWIRAQPNLPIFGSSSVATGAGSRAEVRIGDTTVSLAPDTQADFLQVSDDGLVVRVARGRLAATTSAFATNEPIELAAGDASLLVRSAGRYVLGLDKDSGMSLAKVHEGQADLRLGEASLPLYPGQEASIDTSGPLSQDRRQLATDEFDSWVAQREKHWNELASDARLPPEMTGADELAAHGEWQDDPGYGALWFPSGVDETWTPHRDGRWTTVAPLGEVWVAAVPWGFATSHYGRWHRIRDRWAWAPGVSGHHGSGKPVRPAPARGPVWKPPPGDVWRRPQQPIAAPAPQPAVQPMVPQPQPQPGPWTAPPPPRAWQPHPPQPHRQPPRLDPGPGRYPDPPRAYPTPPRQYPNPSQPWPQQPGRAPAPR